MIIKKKLPWEFRLLFYNFRSNFLLWHVFILLQWSVADDVEVVKSVTSEDLEKQRDEGGDQVALESEHQEQHIHPPPHIVQGYFEFIVNNLSGNLMLRNF